MMLTFCVSCSENGLYHKELHNMNYTCPQTHILQKDNLLEKYNHLKQEQEMLQNDINNITFD